MRPWPRPLGSVTGQERNWIQGRKNPRHIHSGPSLVPSWGNPPLEFCMLDDKEARRLLLRTAARDEGSAEAFERLYRTCAPLLLGVAQRVVGRRELAEEVLHDGFGAVWRTAESFDALPAQPLAWMAAIVRNRAIDVRASHDVSRVDSYHDAPDDDPERSEEHTSELQSRLHLVCRLLLEKKKKKNIE